MLSYHDFRRAVAGLYNRRGMIPQLDLLINEKLLLMHGLSDFNILDMIFIARNHACADPHDKIYGLQGFFGSQTQAAIQPSYDVSFTHVFKQFFLDCSRMTARLELLAHCRYDKNSDLPSWVPDWRSHGPSPFIQPAADSQAAGLSRAYFGEFRVDELQSIGLQLADVQALFSRCNHVNDALVWLRAFITEAVTQKVYPTGEAMYTALAKLLCRGQTTERYPYHSKIENERKLVRWWMRRLRMAMNGDLSNEHQVRELHDFLDRIRDLLTRLQFFKTGGSYIGSGPLEILPGDRICVLLGLYLPLIIRPTENQKYFVIGPCYIQGFMDSEALLGQLPKGWSVRQMVRDGRFLPHYRNSTMTGDDYLAQDPRLGRLDSSWRWFDQRLTADDPEHVDFFRNQVTGEVINYDPRMSIEALERRGVELQTITLV